MTTPHSDIRIFVFGSNHLGIHGAGAALHARKHHGAILGVGEGAQGTSYALPTKKTPYISLSLAEIEQHVQAFLKHARAHPELTFEVTAVGCGRAGHDAADIAPMFADAPDNCLLPAQFIEQLSPGPRP
ncbi:A1S_2505 family phage non-structural protein [Xanthomonas arboricola]|uniref:Uncharacterized protein n=1 Tax=Xanthomonas arboricola TaxID=56448 RepID=A0AB73H2M4_9XANT|nr:hypothetical protein [Xanthomonas arboricola]MBB5672297.1 hypothetical protein [Xanthomonas arboricola]